LQKLAAFGDDDAEALVDKLKGGDYAEVIKTAQSAADAQLCLRPDGSLAHRAPHTAFAGLAAMQASAAATTAEAPAQKAEDEEDELTRLRKARMAQMRDEQVWRTQGHGNLRELADEREFVEAIKPHARAVVLLDDELQESAEGVRRALERLSRKHLEAQFCRLRADRAVFLTRMVEIEGYPAIFVLRDGMVTRHLPPDLLFQYSSSTSPLFTGHLAKLLLRVDALTSAEEAEGSASEDEA